MQDKKIIRKLSHINVIMIMYMQIHT